MNCIRCEEEMELEGEIYVCPICGRSEEVVMIPKSKYERLVILLQELTELEY